MGISELTALELGKEIKEKHESDASEFAPNLRPGGGTGISGTDS